MVLFACVKSHPYLHGRAVTLETGIVLNEYARKQEDFFSHQSTNPKGSLILIGMKVQASKKRQSSMFNNCEIFS